MRYCVYGYLMFVCAGLLSCTRDLPLPEIKNGKKIVLLGELVAGQPVYVRAGGSVPIAGSTPTIELVRDLSLSLQDRAGTNIGLTGTEDSLSAALSTIPFTSGQLIRPADNYVLTATHSSLGKVTANVPIPAPFTATIVNVDSTSDPNSIGFDIMINDPATEEFYVIEALKQKMSLTGYFYFNNQWLGITENKTVYDSLLIEGIELQKKYDTVYCRDYRRYMVRTADVYTENLKNGSSFDEFKRILLSDFAFKGNEYVTRVYVNRQLTLETNDFKGRLVIMVKSVSKDYFQYLTTYEDNQALVGLNNTTSISNSKSNVQNGIGIVGGVFKNEFYYFYDTWEY